MTTTIYTIASDHGISWTTGTEGETVSTRAIPTADARRLCAALEQAGHEASDAPDHDDRALSWVYVTKAHA